MSEPVRICLWSGPRNVSTALLYSFAQRADTRAVDEPLYAHYLTVSGADHPGREDVLRAQDGDGGRVVETVLLGPCDRPVAFFKSMAHHLEGLDRAFLLRLRNVILTRDPEQMLPSLQHQIPNPVLRDTGLAVQTEIFDALSEAGAPPPVLDARLLLENPEGVLRQLCAAVGIDFDPAMLQWPPGPKEVDGIWAPHWYDNVWRSRAFLPFSEKAEPFPDRLRPLLEQCRPHYMRLREHALDGRRV